MVKRHFVLVVLLLTFFCGCSQEKAVVGNSQSVDEKAKSVVEIPVSDPIIYASEAILEDDASETVKDYYSVYAMDYIREIIPQNPYAEDSEDGYIGDNIISYYGEKEILRKPVYMQAEPDIVQNESLGRVQWLDGETAMIDGRFVFNKETLEKEEFNPNWENMLNYALNKNKDKLVVSSMDDDKTLYRLTLYDFESGEWKILFEGKSDRIYYFNATLLWKNDNEIIFSAGIDRKRPDALFEDELDIYIINIDTYEYKLLAEKAYLLCKTGSFVDDKVFYSRDIAEEDGSVYSEIWVYDFKVESELRINESGISNQFRLPKRGLFGFYKKDERCIKLCCDESYALLGKIDISSVVLNDDNVVEVVAGADYIRFSVYDRQNESSKHYKVNISDLRERNYFFIDHLYIGYTELGEFYNRTHSENVYGEFLSQEGYDAYSQDEFLFRSTEAKIGDMPDLDHSINWEDAELLESFASRKEDYESVFELPVMLSEKAYNILYPYYNGHIDFGDGALVTNAKHNVLPRKVEKTTANESDLEIIRKELAKDGITKAPINVTEGMVCDLDGDGTSERIVFANSSDDKIIADADSGNYTMAFVVRENGVELLYKEISRYGETIPDSETGENYFDHWVNHSSCAGIYDLNGDGKFEICMELGMYEHGRYMVFSKNEDGKYTLVLNSEFGT